jgi:hypothetical protein
VSAPGQLSQSAARALVKKADGQYVAGTTTEGRHQHSSTVGGSSHYVDTDLDGLFNLIAQTQSLGSNPSHIVIDPKGLASLRNLKVLTSDSTQPLLGAGREDMQQTLFGLPVIVNRFVPAYSGLLIDRNAVLDKTPSPWTLPRTLRQSSSPRAWKGPQLKKNPDRYR